MSAATNLRLGVEGSKGGVPLSTTLQPFCRPCSALSRTVLAFSFPLNWPCRIQKDCSLYLRPHFVDLVPFPTSLPVHPSSCLSLVSSRLTPSFLPLTRLVPQPDPFLPQLMSSIPAHTAIY